MDYKKIDIAARLNMVDACEETLRYKAWCYDNNRKIDNLDTRTPLGEKLLKEICKPERKAWLDYCIKKELVKEVKETYQIGDVIRLHSSNTTYIINSCTRESIVLNSYSGLRFLDPTKVDDIFVIQKNELEDVVGGFTKVGHGAKDLIKE